MTRLSAAGVTVAITLVLAGCGGSTITVQYMNKGQVQGSVVVSGDSDGVNQLKAKVPTEGSANELSVVDGDQHQGNQVCATDVSKNGKSYHFVAYGQLDPAICSDNAALSSDLP